LFSCAQTPTAHSRISNGTRDFTRIGLGRQRRITNSPPQIFHISFIISNLVFSKPNALLTVRISLSRTELKRQRKKEGRGGTVTQQIREPAIACNDQ
jgi:hypothetical protein